MINLICPFCGSLSYNLNAPRTYKCPKCSRNVEYVEPKVERKRTFKREITEVKETKFNLKENDITDVVED